MLEIKYVFCAKRFVAKRFAQKKICDIIFVDGDKMFIGRYEEIKEIREALDSSNFEAIILYGRRRVGKTEIIKEAIKDIKMPIVNFECKRTSVSFNLDLLTKLLVETFNYGPLKFETFDDFFTFVFKESLEKEFVLIIDEFSFLLEEDFSIESSLARVIDKYKNESKLKLIIILIIAMKIRLRCFLFLVAFLILIPL